VSDKGVLGVASMSEIDIWGVTLTEVSDCTLSGIKSKPGLKQ
jgi:hypothetical protein